MSQNITVIGIGRLGLGLALLLEKSGYNICGVDIFQNYVNSLNKKVYKTKEPKYEELLKTSKNFTTTTDLKKGLDHSDFIFIIVQTPNSGGSRFYDHSILSNLLTKIQSYNVLNKHLIIGCTVMPKYIDQIANNLITNNTISYNPEFVAQGCIIQGFEKPDIILVGTESEKVAIKLKEIYDKITLNKPLYCIVKPLEAEIIKISLNAFITTKLSFANMLSDMCDNMGADKYKILNSIGKDSRIGNRYFSPGYSFGGPCFPRDTKALQLLLDQNNINSDLLKATTKYNEVHIDYEVDRLLKKGLDEYLITNVCYRENSKIPIIEESAKLKIAEKLVKNGKKVIIKDEIQLINEVKKAYGNIFEYIIE